MKKTHHILSLASFMLVGLTLPGIAQDYSRDLSLHWRKTADYNGRDNLDLHLVLKNNSEQQLELKDMDLWFNAIFPILERDEKTYSIKDETGNLFKTAFKEGLFIPAKDSLVMTYTSKYALVNQSTVPNGFYLQHRQNTERYYPIELHVEPLKLGVTEENHFWAALYDKNVNRQVPVSPQRVLPRPLSMDVSDGEYVLNGASSYWVDPIFAEEMPHLQKIAEELSGVQFYEGDEKKAAIRVIHLEGQPNEGYILCVDKDGITVEASTGTGVFYAIQTLRSLLNPEDFRSSAIRLPYTRIQDAPRYAYRGFMMDIARNFKDKQTILRYLDMLSRYKLNTFHLHFSDDEGWRIEMPSLPELTEIGARRTPLYRDAKGIQPAYGSGGVRTDAQYLSKADFIEILQYAKARHITIVPEIETPGHARASIKAMDVRYQRFIEEGNRAKAEEFMLRDLDDKSVYSSVQYFTDNVMNVALPSVYTFLGVVIDDIKAMYAEAGVELKKISMGGDEVPNGVWEKSPKIQDLMKSEGMKSVYDVWPYYVAKVNALAKEKGLQMAGWEEFGMVNRGKGMVVNDALSGGKMQLDVWNNLIGGGQEDLAYRLANAGYETVYISANNNYFDMAWDTNFAEPGLKWASYADLYQSFLFLPEAFFANIEHTVNGAKFGKERFADKVRLTEEGKKNLVGVKGGLWAETIVDSERMDYMVFPRLFALAQRAWSPKATYEDEQIFKIEDFNTDYSAFIQKVGLNELQKVEDGLNFRLPAVGVKKIDGKLHANVEFPGFAIHYTTDGNVPSKNSPQYSVPLELKQGQKVQFATVDALGRTSLVSTYQE